MHASATTTQPKILVIQDELLGEMRLAREYAGQATNDHEALRMQLAAIVDAKEVGAAILDTALDIGDTTAITEILIDLAVPFVFAGRADSAEIPGEVMALTMAPDLANLTLLGQSILGRPTYH